VKVKPLYNVVVANLTGAMIFGIMKTEKDNETDCYGIKIHCNKIGDWKRTSSEGGFRRFECIRLVLKHFTRNMVFIPFK
jgi:hypothetical protein